MNDINVYKIEKCFDKRSNICIKCLYENLLLIIYSLILLIYSLLILYNFIMYE